MNVMREKAHQIKDETIAFRRDLHMHPEASFQEFRTTDKVAAALDELGVSYRRLEPTGLIAEIGKPGKTVALRADMDALSIQEQTGCAFKSVNDGFMHACGHDAHTAMLLGAVKVLNSMKDELPGTVRFLFQPAEEVGKGAKAVVAQGGMEGVDAAFGIHCSVQTPVGALQCHPGGIAAAADRFKITVKGKACHGAYPQTGMDATVCASAMILNLQTMVSREFSPMDTLVVTVGSIHSGSRFNIVSGEAVMEGTIRSFSREVHEQIPVVLKRICEETAKTFRCTAEVDYDVLTDVLVNEENMVELGFEAARKVTDPQLVTHNSPAMGAEDFCEYTKYAPSAFFRLGVGGEWPGHSDHYEIDEEALEIGVAFYAQVAVDALGKLTK